MPDWRITTWLIILWCALIGIWVLYGLNANQQAVQQCLNQGVLTYRECHGATEVGTGIGLSVVLAIGFAGFVILSLIWFMTGRNQRACPVCGSGVKRGRTVCSSCDYDFARASGAAYRP